MKKKKIFSAIQPSGLIHIGNYIGAILQWKKFHNLYDSYFCIADLHSLTNYSKVFNYKKDKEIIDLACFYISCGLNFEDNTVFLQSDAIYHPYMTWLLGSIAPFSWLENMIQYKIKSKNNNPISLFLYPLLMSSDVLLYDIDYIPVGSDQFQHVELIRKLARKFNSIKKDFFLIPEILINKVPKIMSLSNPNNKMSKSNTNNLYSNLNILKDDIFFIKCLKSSITDSNSHINFSNLSRGMLNLFNIYISFSDNNINDIYKEYDGKKYSFFKNNLIELLIFKLSFYRNRFRLLIKEKDFIYSILKKNSEKVQEISSLKTKKLYQIINSRSDGRAA